MPTIAAAAGEFDGILLSPGPGTPERAGASIALVRACAAARHPAARRVPRPPGHRRGVRRHRRPRPGAAARQDQHRASTPNVGVLQGLPDPFTATRYHSLTILPETMPAELEVTARTDGGVIMGVQHAELPIHGVQFHPESILTEGGHRMLANWLALLRRGARPRRWCAGWRTRSPTRWRAATARSSA